MPTPLTLWGITLDSGLLAALLAFCAVTATIMLLRARQFRQVTGRELAREQIARLREQREIRVAMDELLGRLEAFNRQVNDQLDAKLRAVDQAVARIDERLAGADADRLTTPAAAPAPAPKPEQATRPTAERIARRARDLAALGNLVESAAKEDRSADRCTPDPAPIAAPSSPAPARSTPMPSAELAEATGRVSAAVAAAPRPAITPHHQQVYDLFDAGRSPIRIAEELRVSLGEVELILNLRNFG